MKDKISIHDNEVLSYKMIFPEKSLILTTSFKDEITDILFCDVLAYSFENAGEQNILFEVVDSSIKGFVGWYARNKETQKSLEFGFPIRGINEPDKLKTFLLEEGYQYYEINASVGLDGFVIAKEMVFQNSH